MPSRSSAMKKFGMAGRASSGERSSETRLRATRRARGSPPTGAARRRRSRRPAERDDLAVGVRERRGAVEAVLVQRRALGDDPVVVGELHARQARADLRAHEVAVARVDVGPSEPLRTSSPAARRPPGVMRQSRSCCRRTPRAATAPSSSTSSSSAGEWSRMRTPMRRAAAQRPPSPALRSPAVRRAAGWAAPARRRVREAVGDLRAPPRLLGRGHPRRGRGRRRPGRARPRGLAALAAPTVTGGARRRRRWRRRPLSTARCGAVLARRRAARRRGPPPTTGRRCGAPWLRVVYVPRPS